MNMDSPSDTDEDLKTDEGQQQEVSPTSDTTDIENAENSSNSESPTEELSTFDVAMKALKGEDDDTGGKSDDNSDNEDGKEPDADPDKKGDEEGDKKSEDEFEDFTAEERANLKKATTERFDKLKGLYHNQKEEVKTLTARLEETQVDADNYRQFTGFLEQNRMSQDEANDLFNIGALMKNDPVRALEAITPHYQKLLHMTGNVMPDDLKQQVDQGFITQSHAQELSRLRATGQTNHLISQEQQQHQQRQNQIKQQTDHINGIQNTITDWERKWSSSDPDYAQKKDRVLERVELMLARAGRDGSLPKTADDAVKLAMEAKKHVETEMRQYAPRQKVNTVDGGKTSVNMPEPQNTADVIRRTLNQ